METPILPGDEELIAAMTMANPDARRWFWGMWGLNHCFLSILKLQAINQKDKAMLKKLFIPTAATFLYCVGPERHGRRRRPRGFIAGLRPARRRQRLPQANQGPRGRPSR